LVVDPSRRDRAWGGSKAGEAAGGVAKSLPFSSEIIYNLLVTVGAYELKTLEKI